LTLGLTRSQVGQQFDDFLGTKPASQAVSQPGVALRLKSGKSQRQLQCKLNWWCEVVEWSVSVGCWLWFFNKGRFMHCVMPN